jgi:hypothetical protein
MTTQSGRIEAKLKGMNKALRDLLTKFAVPT